MEKQLDIPVQPTDCRHCGAKNVNWFGMGDVQHKHVRKTVLNHVIESLEMRTVWNFFCPRCNKYCFTEECTDDESETDWQKNIEEDQKQ